MTDHFTSTSVSSPVKWGQCADTVVRIWLTCDNVSRTLGTWEKLNLFMQVTSMYWVPTHPRDCCKSGKIAGNKIKSLSNGAHILVGKISSKHILKLHICAHTQKFRFWSDLWRRIKQEWSEVGAFVVREGWPGEVLLKHWHSGTDLKEMRKWHTVVSKYSWNVNDAFLGRKYPKERQ